MIEKTGTVTITEDKILVDRTEYERLKGDALRCEQMKEGILLGSTNESEMIQGLNLISKVLEQYAALGTPEELKIAIEQAKKHDEQQTQLAEAKKRLADYKEPDYGPIETFDDAPDTSKAQPEDLKAKLAKYEAIGTPEELRTTLEKANHLEEQLTAAQKEIKDCKDENLLKLMNAAERMASLLKENRKYHEFGTPENVAIKLANAERNIDILESDLKRLKIKYGEFALDVYEKERNKKK
jgi:hypothetical protein